MCSTPSPKYDIQGEVSKLSFLAFPLKSLFLERKSNEGFLCQPFYKMDLNRKARPWGSRVAPVSYGKKMSWVRVFSL
jgi:hypothetical protein